MDEKFSTFTGETFFELFEKCVISKRITLSTDSIVEIRLRENQQSQSQFILADNADMNVSEITASLSCKFVQFIITQKHALTSSKSCEEPFPVPCRGTKNAFALLMHNSTSIILPSKPKT